MTEIITEWKTGTVAVAAAILLRTAGEFNLMWNASLVWKSIRAEIFLAPMPGLACINTLNQFRFCHWGTCATVSSDIHFDPGGPTPQPFPVAITPPHQFPTTTKHPLRIFTGPTGDLTRKGERGAMWGWFKKLNPMFVWVFWEIEVHDLGWFRVAVTLFVPPNEPPVQCWPWLRHEHFYWLRNAQVWQWDTQQGEASLGKMWSSISSVETKHMLYCVSLAH